jgi:Galactosyltransferase
MPKLAICVKSCHRDLDAGFHNAIRSTWGKDAKALGIDVFFFVGRDPSQQDTRISRRYISGEVVLDCDDSYDDLPKKTRRICQWLNGKIYSHIFLGDNDTFVRPNLLSKTGFENFDYYGWPHANTQFGMAPFRYTDDRGIEHKECRAWASGGIGYFLSRKAAQFIAVTPPSHWAEDFYVGQTLAPEIDNKTLKAFSAEPQLDGPTEHWNKRILSPFEPKILEWAYQHGGFRQLFKKGLLSL